MKFLELHLKGFGKFHDRTISFTDGINVIYGKNEAGKSTMHTFIRGMLFGIQPQRGRASKNLRGFSPLRTERTYLPNRTKFPEKQEISDNNRRNRRKRN